MWKWLINDHWSHLSISFSSLHHIYWKIYYWLVYALYRRWLPIFMEIFLISFEVCAIDLWIQLTLFQIPSLSATGNSLMVRIHELFYLMGNLSDSLSKALVMYIILFIIVIWHRVNMSTLKTSFLFSQKINNNNVLSSKKLLFICDRNTIYLTMRINA